MDSTTYAEAVAGNVAAAIREADRSVLSIAEATGIPRSTLDRRLKSHGLSPFTVRELEMVAAELGVKPSHLLMVDTTARRASA